MQGISMIDGHMYEADLPAAEVRSYAPIDDRIVVLQDVNDLHGVVIFGARYRNKRWIDSTTGVDVTDNLSPNAVWTEPLLITDHSFRTH